MALNPERRLVRMKKTRDGIQETGVINKPDNVIFIRERNAERIVVRYGFPSIPNSTLSFATVPNELFMLAVHSRGYPETQSYLHARYRPNRVCKDIVVSTVTDDGYRPPYIVLSFDQVPSIAVYEDHKKKTAQQQFQFFPQGQEGMITIAGESMSYAIYLTRLEHAYRIRHQFGDRRVQEWLIPDMFPLHIRRLTGSDSQIFFQLRDPLLQRVQFHQYDTPLPPVIA